MKNNLRDAKNFKIFSLSHLSNSSMKTMSRLLFSLRISEILLSPFFKFSTSLYLSSLSHSKFKLKIPAFTPTDFKTTAPDFKISFLTALIPILHLHPFLILQIFYLIKRMLYFLHFHNPKHRILLE